MKKLPFLMLFIGLMKFLSAQPDSLKLTISGTMGVSYEGYRLSTNPETPSFYNGRKPSDLVRFIFQPVISYGKFKLPFNFSFSPMRNNFGSPPFGMGNLPGFPKQSFKQWLTNPMNNLGLNPSLKWAEIPLGTQYMNYSELSTGDIGTFGYGVNLSPGKFRLRFFSGVSQQAYQPYVSTTPPFTFIGAYKRTITMGQIGLEKEGKYFTGFNIVKGIDNGASITNPLTGIPATPTPEENFIISFVTRFTSEKGWYGQAEAGTTISTRDVNAMGPNPLLKNFEPYISTNLSSFRDHAMLAGFGKKGKNWDVGIGGKWLGAGYYSMGYPFVQNDRFDYTFNTRFNALKNKMNMTASVGQRIGNLSIKANRTRQLIANANLFSQFSEHFNLNVSFNNFGFHTPGLLGIKNVGNDLAVNPTWTWTKTSSSHLVSLSYNWSKYDEKSYSNSTVSNNNSHTGMLMYVPSFFNKPNLSTDFSVMFFRNTTMPGDILLSIWTVSAGTGYNFSKPAVNLRSQLQFNNTTMQSFSSSHNLTFTLGADWNLSKRLNWNTSLTTNLFKYGDELTPPPTLLGAHYTENMLKTALLYKFGN
jgi:hypothetical protein